MNVNNSKEYMSQLSVIADAITLRDCTVLVTGATGMIGSSLVDVLLMADREYGKNIKVIAMGRKEGKLKDRFSYAPNQDQLSFIVQDISAPIKPDTDIDYIIHTASNADPRNYSLYPAETLLTNVYGTNAILDYCKDHPGVRMLFTSTFEVYGKDGDRDVYEEETSGVIDLNQIRSCYPVSKKCAEILLRCYHSEYGVDGVIARLSSIYGPTMSKEDSKAHAQFMRNGLKGEDIVLKSKGSQKRTYCYLMDAVDGIFTILEKGQSGEAYNVSNDQSVATIAEVAGTVAKICGTQVIFDIPDEIERRGFSRPQNCVLDNSRLRSLGFRGKYSLEDGLRSTMNIIRELWKEES